jgi:hypothetical protein
MNNTVRILPYILAFCHFWCTSFLAKVLRSVHKYVGRKQYSGRQILSSFYTNLHEANSPLIHIFTMFFWLDKWLDGPSSFDFFTRRMHTYFGV